MEINQVKKMVVDCIKKYGRVDILVNNAGHGNDAPVEKINIERFKEHLWVGRGIGHLIF